MKNRGLIIVTIVILLLVIIGLISLLCASLNGKYRFKDWGSKKSEQIIFDSSYEVEKIENLEILSRAGDIEFKESTDGKVRVLAYGENEQDLKVDLAENHLKVDYSNYRHKNGFFGVNFYSNDIVIYMPSDYAKEINLNANYGDIEIMDLENASIQIEADCGDVTLGKVKNVFVKNDYGDVKIESVLNKASIDLSCGDVKINSLTIAEDSSIINNFGDIKIGTTNEIYIDAKTDLGDVKVNHNERQAEVTLKVENDCGDIKVEN